MPDHLEFLRPVPGAAQPLGPVPPLDPVPPRRNAPDPIGKQRAELQNRLALVAGERAAVVERMRRDHRHFIELEACSAALVGAMVELERARLANGVESTDAGA